MTASGPTTAIRRLIEEKGKITFAEFMAMALFAPGTGYYVSGEERIGEQGDFYTAPTAHPVFGALLARQLKQMWHILGAPERYWVIEIGSGTGRLAKDILDYSVHLDNAFCQALRYVTLERSPPVGEEPDRRAGHTRDQSVVSASLPFNNVVGCVLSNELLDSFPVHRIIKRQGQLREKYVDLAKDGFSEVIGDLSDPLLQQYLREFDVELAEGQSVNVCLELEPWCRDLGLAIERGFVLTIDYGTVGEQYGEAHISVEATGYLDHTTRSELLDNVGSQDLSAPVDFGTLMHYGERHGLSTLGITSQRAFLLNLGMEHYLEELPKKRLSQREEYANQMGMLDLIKSDGLGNFKVLIQTKGVKACDLMGLNPGTAHHPVPDFLPILTDEHVSLWKGRYPHLDFDPSELWK
jgi:SAM-dependent MidA family methyltransferase